MINGINPLADPVSFIILYYIGGMASEGPVILLKLALLSSVIAFPFVLLGGFLFKKAIGNWKANRYLQLIAADFSMVVFFWLALGLWRAAWGGNFITGSVLSIVQFFVVGTAVSFPLAVLGDYLKKKIDENWKIPGALAAYLLCLLSSIIFWVAAKLSISVLVG